MGNPSVLGAFMPSPQNSSLINEYSAAYMSLQSGKRQLIQWGADAVLLNRYIVDAAGSTGKSDPAPVLQSINLIKVTEGDTEQQSLSYCDNALKQLVALQEEVVVLQKSARESGISAGLLTIVGQAASQSPDDNGASVLRQLGELVGSEQSDSNNEIAVSEPAEDQAGTVQLAENATPEDLSDRIELDGAVANDIDTIDYERLTPLQQLGVTIREHWRPLLMDASVCVVATGIAISLVN